MELIDFHNGVCRDATRSPRLAIDTDRKIDKGNSIVHVVTRPTLRCWHLYVSYSTNILAEVRLPRLRSWGLLGYDLIGSIQACVVNDLKEAGIIDEEQVLYY